MKRFRLRLLTLTLLLSLIFAFAAGSAGAEGEKLVVTLENKTDAPVFAAIAGMSTGGDDSFDFSKGWWRVDPGQARNVYVGDFGGPMFEYFYYASSMGGKRVWQGDPDGSTFWIHPAKAFDVHPGKELPGGRMAPFMHFGVDPDGKAKIAFTAK